MSSVTQRIKNIKQPKGGYVPISMFQKSEADDGYWLHEATNIHASLIGLVVDYLTRMMMGVSREVAFCISLRGAAQINQLEHASWLLSQIVGTDANSIFYACQLVGYDVCWRAGAEAYRPVENICADEHTIENIQIMLQRAATFWNFYGPVVKTGFTFEGGYTSIIDAGDGDYLSGDTLWDFKVSKNGITTSQTLQLLIYYLMGKHSVYSEFSNIKKLGIFNPYKNCLYVLSINQIPLDVIAEVEKSIIGYGTWTLTDLQIRYGVSAKTICSVFFANELPYYNFGSSILFDQQQVIQWEMCIRYVEIRSKRVFLPAYKEYGIKLKADLVVARVEKNKMAMKQIKQKLREGGYYQNHYAGILIVLIVGALFSILWCLYLYLLK